MTNEAAKNFPSVARGECVKTRQLQHTGDDILKNAWDQLDSGKLSMRSFFSRTVHTIPKSENPTHYIFNDDETDDDVDGIQIKKNTYL